MFVRCLKYTFEQSISRSCIHLLQFDKQLNLGLVRSAAARESGLDVDEFEGRLQVRTAEQEPNTSRQQLVWLAGCGRVQARQVARALAGMQCSSSA